MSIVLTFSKNEFFSMVRKTYPEVTNDSAIEIKMDDDEYIRVICEKPDWSYRFLDEDKSHIPTKEFDPAEINLDWPTEEDDEADGWEFAYHCQMCEDGDCIACSRGESSDNPGHLPGCDDWDDCFGCWSDHTCIVEEDEEE